MAIYFSKSKHLKITYRSYQVLTDVDLIALLSWYMHTDQYDAIYDQLSNKLKFEINVVNWCFFS